MATFLKEQFGCASFVIVEELENLDDIWEHKRLCPNKAISVYFHEKVN